MRRRLLPSLSMLLLAACGSTEEPAPADPGSVVAERDQVDFGAVLVDGSSRARVRFQNRGRKGGDLDVQVTGPFRIASTDPTSLEPSGVATVEVVFEPKAKGPAAGLLTAGISGVGDPVQVHLNGSGDVPEIQVDRGVEFGEVAIGTTAHATGKITSLTSAPLTVRIELTGKDAGAYGLPARTLRLEANGSADVEVTFSPGAEVTSLAQLQLTPCDGCAPQTMPISGRGLGPRIDVQPRTVDFGHVRPGSVGTAAVTVKRQGDTPAWLTSVELVAGAGSPFAVQAPEVPLELGADAVQIPVTFTPTTRTASSTVLHLVAGGQRIDVALTGDGGDGGLTIFPAALDFGWVPAGSTTIAFVISDHGTDLAKDIEAVRIEGSTAFTARADRKLPTTARGLDLRVDITLNTTQPGTYTAELVVEIEGEPPRRAPITATVVSGGFCDLQVDPTVRMGLATVGKGLERVVRLRNNASDDCMVSEVEIAGSPSFSIPGVTRSRIFLVPARGVQPITVRFAPTAAGLEPETATITLRKTDLMNPYSTIAVSGQGTGIDLALVPGEVILPPAPLGSEQLVPVDVQNLGRVPVQISAGLASASAALSLDGTAPASVAGQSSATLIVRFHPTDIVRTPGELQIFTPIASEPWVVPVTGQVNSDACGTLCTAPVVACPAERAVSLEAVTLLSGAARHPAGTPVTCTWAVATKPGGSTAAPSSGCGALFQPDVAGTYELELTGSGGGTATCRTKLTAASAGGLWVSAQPAAKDDLDLHLFDQDAGDLASAASWRGSTDDCWRRRPAPDWGGAAASPVYQAGGDGRPEVVRISDPEVGASYRVGLHWPSTRSGNASLAVETTIWCGGKAAGQVSTTLDQPYQAAELGTVTVTAKNTCTFTPSSTRVVVLP